MQSVVTRPFLLALQLFARFFDNFTKVIKMDFIEVLTVLQDSILKPQILYWVYHKSIKP
jgi:hypothetical protein